MFLSQSVQIGQSHKYLTAMNYLFENVVWKTGDFIICGEKMKQNKIKRKKKEN